MNKKKQRTLFADNLKTIRHFYKMDCTEFAKLLGVDGKRLSEVERGRLLPTAKEINAVLKEMRPMKKEVLLNNIMGLHLQTFPTKSTTHA